MKSLLVTITSLLLISACKKDTTTYTIKGVLLKSCGGQPIANQQLLLEQVGGNNTHYDLATNTTDAMGNFKFNFQLNNTTQNLSIRSSTSFGYYTYMEEIPIRKNLENVMVYESASTKVQVRLNVTNPYTNKDTLYHTDVRTLSIVKIAGPFTSGNFYFASNAIPASSQDFRFDSMYLGVSYKINNNSYTSKQFASKVCGQSEVVLDIK